MKKKKLEQLLYDYSPVKTASVFSALLLNPKYHPHQYTLETAIKYTLSFCKGDLNPTKELLKKVYDEIHTSVSMYEDPIEDVFISKLLFNNTSYKVQLGLWEGGIHSTQITLNILELLPNEIIFLELKEKVESILSISNSIIELNNLEYNKLLDVNPLETLDYADIKDIEKLLNDVSIKNTVNILPLIDRSSFDILFEEEFGNSILEEKPFYSNDDETILLLPTAITVCIRIFIIKFFIFHEKKDLFSKYYEEMLSKELYKTRIFGKLINSPLKFFKKKGISTFKFAENVIEFDTNYFFHFIFVLDTLEHIEDDWFAGFISDKKCNVSDFIDSRIKKAKLVILNKDSNNKGCSLIIPCGVGRGFSLTSKFITNDNWFYESVSNHDLITISNDKDCTPNLIWRIIEAQYKLENSDTKLLNLNGLLNLYGYIKDNDYSVFVNEDFNEEVSAQPFSIITIGNNYNAYVREKVALDTDYKEVENIRGEKIIVRRAFSDSLFSTNIKYNLYIPEEIDKESFLVVYIDYDYIIWIEQDIKEEYDFTLQFKLFDTLITWFCKTVFILNKHNIKINNNLKLWNINYSLEASLDTLKKDITKSDIFNSYNNTDNDVVLNTNFNKNILKGFMFEENFSEQAMVITFLNYLGLEETSIGNLLKEIIVNEDARLLHFFQATKYREQFDIAEEKPITIHRVDEQIIKLNLGWSFRTKKEGNTIEGKDSCTQYLNKLMDVVWKKLQAKLKLIERENLIIKLLKNHEYSDKEKDIWEHTFKSNLALQNDKSNLYDVSINKLNEYTASSLSSRLIIEMAICECSVKCGKDVGELDIQELMSFASFMHIAGGLSEAIKYEAIPPKLVISSFGDILFDSSFNDLIIKKYGYIFNQKILDYKTKEYSSKYKEKNFTEKTNHLFDDGFIDAYTDEFGFSVDEARLLLDFLEDYGLKINKLVYTVNYNDFIELFEPQYKEVFIKVLDSLIIYTRRDWTKIPKFYKSSDWQPWKFRRRYSVIMKPIIQIDSFEGLIAISPQLVRTAYINFIRNIHEGNLEANHFKSKRMKRWVGNLVKEKGLAFNSRVKEKFIELGFEAKEEIKLTEILNKKLEDFGDVDVLAWNKEKRIVYAIECKDLETAKTQSEISRQLYEFKGQVREIHGKNKKDRLFKHYVRLEELKKDLIGVKKFVKFVSDFELKALVVFSNIVPMNFDTNRNFIDEVDFCSFDNLDEI